MNITINGVRIETTEDRTVLAIARELGTDIPTLCYHEALGPRGTCRLCIVEVETAGRRSLMTSCNLAPVEGMVILTNSEWVVSTRQILFELLLGRAGETEQIVQLAARYGVTGTRFRTERSESCVRCGRCVRVCEAKIGTSAICFAHRGDRRSVTAEFGALSDLCIGCGACASVCPTNAITIKDEGNKRIIRTQDRLIAEHKLEPCRVCGTPFIPQKYLAYVSGRTPDQPVTKKSLQVCPVCSRSKGAESIAGEILHL